MEFVIILHGILIHKSPSTPTLLNAELAIIHEYLLLMTRPKAFTRVFFRICCPLWCRIPKTVIWTPVILFWSLILALAHHLCCRDFSVWLCGSFSIVCLVQNVLVVAALLSSFELQINSSSNKNASVIVTSWPSEPKKLRKLGEQHWFFSPLNFESLSTLLPKYEPSVTSLDYFSMDHLQLRFVMGRKNCDHNGSTEFFSMDREPVKIVTVPRKRSVS